MGASLRVTNGQLYDFSKNGGHYWLRYTGGWVDIGAAAPIEGTYATKVTLVPASATFVGTLISSNPIYTFQGMNLVLSRGLSKTDDGAQNTVVTALD